jgi:hypothetical protein
MRIMKKKFIITALVITILCVVGNAGLYFYAKSTVVTPEFLNMIDYIPEKLILKESAIEAEPLHLMGVKIPLNNKKIRHAIPNFSDHELQTILIKIDPNNSQDLELISISALPDITDELYESSVIRQYSKFFYNENSVLDHMKSVYHASLNDYSWWNILHNLRLFELLIQKSIASSTNAEVYDVETPYLKGILTQFNRNEKTLIAFEFTLRNKYYQIILSSINNDPSMMMNMLAATKPIDDIDESYGKMEALFKEKGNSIYPEELLLISMLTLKDPIKSELNKLLKIMEDKNYEPEQLEPLKIEIEHLK